MEDLKAIRERCEAHASGDFVICALYRGEECSVGCRDAWALLSEIARLSKIEERAKEAELLSDTEAREYLPAPVTRRPAIRLCNRFFREGKDG